MKEYPQENEKSAAASVLGPSAVPIVLRVNGEAHLLLVEPRITLAEALRGPLGLTGSGSGYRRGGPLPAGEHCARRSGAGSVAGATGRSPADGGEDQRGNGGSSGRGGAGRGNILNAECLQITLARNTGAPRCTGGCRHLAAGSILKLA